jgi:RNase P/RNase MRP subunit POP5
MAENKTWEKVLYMLNRRDKRRYLAVWGGDYSRDHSKIVEFISKRNSELFGQIATEKANIRFISINEKQVIILSCKLEMLAPLLSTIVLMQPPILLLRISGTLKALRRFLRDAETSVLSP